MEEKDTSKTFFERKEKLVLKEFDSGFSSYQKLEGKVASLRQWTITINVAFVLYAIEKESNILPLLFVIFLFTTIILIHELRERASMKFDKENILLLEKIFDTKEQEIYEDKIINYKFRDEVIAGLDTKTKIKHCWDSILKGEVIVWYGMWFIAWVILISIKRWTWITTPQFSFKYLFCTSILTLILFFGVGAILRYIEISMLLKLSYNKMKHHFKRIFKKKNKRKRRIFGFAD